MLVLYGATLAFGLLAIGMVYASSEQVVLIRPTQNGITSIHPAKTSAGRVAHLRRSVMGTLRNLI